MMDILSRLDNRSLNLYGALVVLLMAAASFVYLVLPHAKSIKSGLDQRDALEQVGINGTKLEEQLLVLNGEVKELQRQLHGDMGNLPAKEMEAFIIGRLQDISWRNSVDLVSVEPRAGGDVETFEETLFKVELSGNYFDLYQWISATGRELGFVVVKEYEMRATDESVSDPKLFAELTMASYRMVNQ